jgi:DNA-binding GntR family transcriptional regulator
MAVSQETGRDDIFANMIISPPNQGESARDWVYRNLFNGIICTDLLPGATLTEQESAKAFDLSRTPVREAFLQLSQNGFVEMTPPRGSRISLIDPSHVEEANYMRVCLEGPTYAAACERLTDEHYVQLKALVEMQRIALNKGNGRRFFELDQDMHKFIYAICSKECIWDHLWNFAVHLIRVRFLHIRNFTPEYRDMMLSEHEAVIDAMRGNDPDRAAALAVSHLTGVMTHIVALEEEFPHYFLNHKFRKPCE